MIKAYLIE